MTRRKDDEELVGLFPDVLDDASAVADQANRGVEIDLDAVARITATVNGAPDLAPLLADQLREVLGGTTTADRELMDRLMTEEEQIGPVVMQRICISEDQS